MNNVIILIVLLLTLAILLIVYKIIKAKNNSSVASVKDSKNVRIDQSKNFYPKELIKSFDEWTRSERFFLQTYFKNEKIEGFIASIREELLKPPSLPIRIFGLAGLGKSRLVYESVKDFPKLNGEIHYCDAALQESEIKRYVTKFLIEKKQGVLIVDNCDIDLHHALQKEINQEGALMHLITIDYKAVERFPAGQAIIIELKPEYFEYDILPQMIQSFYPGFPESDVDKIAKFAQGFPLIATQLADARIKGESNMGELSDDYLIKKLVGLSENEDKDAYSVLRACSLFEKLGCYQDVKNQRDFVATNGAISRLIGADKDKIQIFEDKCGHFIKRGILEKRGRFLIVRPKPLAIRLAADWWRECIERGDGLNIVEEITKNGLGEDLCDQISKLDFLPEAKELTSQLCGPTAPFGKAEVLNTNEGSRLFRSLAEVNPLVAIETLFFHYGNASTDDLLQLNQGRRNLVWTLEKLCFRQDTFDKAAKVMMNLAVAEIEHIGNNATGQLVQLFQLVLPGTSANLEQRFNIIDFALKKNIQEYTELALSCISRSLSPIRGASRMSGAESFGSSPDLKDYYPSKVEVQEYYSKILKVLVDFVCNKYESGIRAKKIIGTSIRSVFDNGFGRLIFESILQVIKCEPEFWSEAYNSVHNIKEFDKNRISKENLLLVEELLTKLRPREFNNNYEIYIKAPIRESYPSGKTYKELRDEGKSYSEIIEENIIYFINEELERFSEWDFTVLYSGRQQQGYFFGKILSDTLFNGEMNKVNMFLQNSYKAIRQIKAEDLDLIVLGGFISNVKSEELRKEILNQLQQIDVPPQHFLNVARFSKPSFENLKEWFHQYSQSNSVQLFNIFAYGRALDYLNTSEIKEFIKLIADFNLEGVYVAIDILSVYVEVDNSTWLEYKSTIRELLMVKGVYSKMHEYSQRYDLYFVSYTKKIIEESDNEFIIFLSTEIIDFIKEINVLSYGTMMENIMLYLIENCMELVWEGIGEQILNNSLFYLTAKFHLGVNEGTMYHEGVLFKSEKNQKILFEWSKRNIPKAPQVLAGIMPTSYINSEGKLDWHPFAKIIIDNFGDEKLVLDELSANLGSFGSVGSSVPYLEGKLELVSLLFNHKFDEVREWAHKYAAYLKNRIEGENIFDEESRLR